MRKVTRTTEIDGDVCTMTIVNSSGTFKVFYDLKYHEILSNIPWTVFAKNNQNYVLCGRLVMNRLIVGNIPSKFRVTCKNGNGLDNRQENLQIVPAGDVRRIPSKNKGSTGSNRSGQKYRAEIYYRGNRIYLGTYNTPREAAMAYDSASKHYYGVCVNFPNETPLDYEVLLFNMRRKKSDEVKKLVDDCLSTGSKTISDIIGATQVDYNAAYKYIRKMADAGVVVKTKTTLPKGGYQYLYSLSGQ